MNAALEEARSPKAAKGRSRVKLVLLTILSTLFGTLLLMNLWSGGNPADQRIDVDYGVGDPQFRRTADNLFRAPFTEGNRIETLLNGESLEAMLKSIEGARESVTFETYVFWGGEVGDRFVRAFADRARAGVRVHLILDWIGSEDLPETAFEEMESAGVDVYRYHAPAWHTIDDLNNRTHRKILVVDGRVGFIGGVGIADHWRGDASHPGEWRDTHFRVEGPVVGDLQAAFMDNWLELGGEVLHARIYFPPLEPVGEAAGQVLVATADRSGEGVRLAYLLSIAAARERILIGNAYFVPDALTIEALVEAKERGVDVRIIVPGRHTDTHIVRKASRASWGPLLEAGIEIYEYQPTMYHCKIMVVDDVWTLVGSANFDARSFNLNDEANLNVWDRELARVQAFQLEQDRKRSERVTLEQWRERPITEKIVDHLASWLGPQL